MNKIPTRRERRLVMKLQRVLRKKKNLSFKRWSNLINESIKNGKTIFSTNRDSFETAKAAQLEQIELKKIDYWKGRGYNESEIEKLRESYAITAVRYLDTWHSDKKTARNLIKEANLSLLNRTL